MLGERLRIVLIAAMLSLVCSASSPAARQTAQRIPTGPSPCGRYQLFQGSWGMSGSAREDVLLRIDTETGRTWIYFKAATTAGSLKEGWVELQEWQQGASASLPK